MTRRVFPSSNRQALVLLSAWAALQCLWTLNADSNAPQQAYIGPGAGIALIGSFFAIFVATLTAFAAILAWPIRRLWRALRGQHALRDAKVKRVVVLGLDGLEPTLTEKFMEAGLLPNLAKLADTGTYRKLGTTTPPLSPVAWSSFSTGTNPGKHNIFDFIRRDPATYLPAISSVRIGEPSRKLRLGKYEIPLSRPSITALRKSKPFWTVLGEHGIFSAVIRVPITFPPDRFRGVQLSAMCVPDLQGTQGTFTYYCDQGESGATMDGDVGGVRILVERDGPRIRSHLRGPVNAMRSDHAEVRVPFTVEPGKNGAAAVMTIGDQTIPMALNAFTDWVRVPFALTPWAKARGICRFYLKQFGERFDMYCTPVQIDPDKPMMPIAHPSVYASYLARSQGSFATLGLAEDTWSLSEGLMNEDAFLEQAYDINAERQAMFFDALDRVRQGTVVCVFDAPDRIQHMFFRFLDDDHPALRGRDNTHKHAIRDLYVRMDKLVGETVKRLDDDSALFVMSDHGFKPFRRGVDLNAWLRDNGYLRLKDDAAASDRTYLAEVDWQRTRAYAIGLAGIYLNLKGRESKGIVEDGDEAKRLADEISSKLTGLRDGDGDKVAVHEAVPARKAYRGPYVGSAPDVIVGYGVDYRVSWDAAVGKTGATVFSDNTKAWSGDHCIHPRLVPGVLFTTLKLKEGEADITDIAPTTLELMGVKTPAYMDGQSLLNDEPDDS